VAEHTAERAQIYSPQNAVITDNRGTDRDGAGSERESERFTHSNISSQKRSRRRRSKKIGLSGQDKIQNEINTLNAPEVVRQSPLDRYRGMMDSKEASTLDFIVAEARIDMKLDQLFETASFKFGS
jgi:hypothetical protein